MGWRPGYARRASEAGAFSSESQDVEDPLGILTSIMEVHDGT